MEEAVFGFAKLAHSFLKGAQWVAAGRTSRNNRLFRLGVSHWLLIINIIFGRVWLGVCRQSFLIGLLEFSGIKKPKLI